MDATNEQEALGCRVCGATGFTPCNLAKHVASILGFATAQTRADRITAVRRCEYQGPCDGIFCSDAVCADGQGGNGLRVVTP